MTNEELRIAIATAKGYSVVEKRNIENRAYYRLLHDGKVVDLWAASASEADAWKFAPNYPEDIAAAWELEGEIPLDQVERYVLELTRVINDKDDISTSQRWQLIHATPRERCLAWLAWKGAK